MKLGTDVRDECTNITKEKNSIIRSPRGFKIWRFSLNTHRTRDFEGDFSPAIVVVTSLRRFDDFVIVECIYCPFVLIKCSRAD